MEGWDCTIVRAPGEWKQGWFPWLSSLVLPFFSTISVPTLQWWGETAQFMDPTVSRTHLRVDCFNNIRNQVFWIPLFFNLFIFGRICFSFPIAFQGWIKSINDIYVVVSTCLFPKIYSKWLLPCSLWRSKLAVQLLKCRNSYKFKKIRHFQCEKHGTLFEKGLQSLQKILNCAIKGEWQELGQISNANYSP